MTEQRDLGLDALSKITIFSKYSKYLPDKQRRETWDEIVDRYVKMMIKKYPKLEDPITVNSAFIREKKILPSMRALQFAGAALEVNNSRGYNCSFLPVDSYHSFSETMFLLLGGTGVGYSVQKHHVAQLPSIKKPTRKKKYLIEDSIMGWSDAVKALMKAYLEGKSMPDFDFSSIRHKGARLITAGGKAPGPEPLKICLVHIQAILDRKQEGDKLSTLDCHDILCHIANSVLSGGIRRSAMISLFSHNDEEMITCKYGSWWELNEQRGRSNNSAVLERGKVTEEEFNALWKRIEASGSGEPGIYWTNNIEWGTNPSLRKGTKVITTNGIFPIEELQDKTFKVKNLNGEISEAKCWLSGKNQKLWKLTLQDGTEYFATKEHEWPVWNGEKYVKINTPDIQAGSKLPFLRENKLFDGILGTYNDGFLSGWILGDGWVSNRKEYSEYGMIVSDLDDESKISDLLIETIIDNVPSFNGNFKPRYQKVFENFEEEIQIVLKKTGTKEISINNKKVDDYIKMFGIVDKNVGLPKSVWVDGSEDYRKGLIDALFSSDGHVSIDKKRITLTSKHKQLVEDVSELLGFYGIKTVIKESISKLNDKEYVRFDLRINENQSIKQFISLFKLSVKHKQDRLDSYVFKNTKSNNQIEVLSVEETELYEDVWDISVYDETHCFQLAKVITGNCCEIGLRPFQFCNLCEVNVNDIKNQQDLNDRVGIAAFFGTLQAGFTNFHYLRDIWQQTTQKDALLGIGMTGIASGEVLKYDLEIAAHLAKLTNSIVSELIGTNEASRITCIKPSGTTSLVLGTSSGIHAWHNDYYLRTMRFNKNEDIATYLMINHPELCEDDVLRPMDTICVRVPVKAPEGSIFRTETAIDTLERVKKFSLEWIKPGHINGDNTHNVSATISIDKSRKYQNLEFNLSNEDILNNTITVTGEEIDEWEKVGEWMWDNREYYNGLSVLDYFGGSYKQAPFEDITKEQYEEKVKYLKSIDLTKVIEMDDLVNFNETVACAAGACEIV